MFGHLVGYSKIVVTGPQRSGTRVASQMIASDTGYEFVDEVEFLITDTHRFRHILQRDGVVVQAPHMLKDMVDDPPRGVFVVLMRRDLAQIHDGAVSGLCLQGCEVPAALCRDKHGVGTQPLVLQLQVRDVLIVRVPIGVLEGG
ncbi:MAG: hypothetical protein ABSE77_23620 [Acidimicrobiales bacterium]